MTRSAARFSSGSVQLLLQEKLRHQVSHLFVIQVGEREVLAFMGTAPFLFKQHIVNIRRSLVGDHNFPGTVSTTFQLHQHSLRWRTGPRAS